MAKLADRPMLSLRCRIWKALNPDEDNQPAISSVQLAMILESPSKQIASLLCLMRTDGQVVMKTCSPKKYVRGTMPRRRNYKGEKFW